MPRRQCKRFLTAAIGVGNAIGPGIELSKSRSQDSGAVVTSDPLGTIQFQGGNGTASVEGARIQSIAGSTWSSTNRDSDLLTFGLLLMPQQTLQKECVLALLVM